MEDFNAYELSAKDFIDKGKYYEAIRIYYSMADGDPSLDGGHLAERLGFCYGKLGVLEAQKYWYNRAIEENPEVYGRLHFGK